VKAPLLPGRRALSGALIYGFVALLWILLSDWALFALLGSQSSSKVFGTIKGAVFVLFTAALLFFLLRRNLTEAQRLSEYQRAVIDAAPLAVFDLTPEGRVKSLWNSAAEGIFGFTAEEAIGQHLPIVPEEKQGEFADLRKRVVSGESFAGVELRRQSKDGRPLTILLGTAPVRNAHGVIDTIMSVVADISDRKATEIALEESLRDKKELLQEVHHRVKNNLQLILSLVRIQYAQGEGDNLDQLRRRVNTIAVVHDQLATPEDVRGIDLRRCLYDVAAEFRSAVADWGGGLEIRINAAAVTVDIDTAVPAMLLAGELIHLSLEQFRDTAGKTDIEITLESQCVPFSLAVSSIADGAEQNGPPPDYAPRDFVLVESLAAQVGCTLRMDVSSGRRRMIAEGKIT
jgi:PAS domain S-box-containing protein